MEFAKVTFDKNARMELAERKRVGSNEGAYGKRKKGTRRRWYESVRIGGETYLFIAAGDSLTMDGERKWLCTASGHIMSSLKLEAKSNSLVKQVSVEAIEETV